MKPKHFDIIHCIDDNPTIYLNVPNKISDIVLSITR